MAHGKPKSASNFLAGATSGFVSTLLLQPLDVVKTRMQMSTAFSKAVGIQSSLALAPNSGMSRTIGVIIRDDGVRGLWRGVVPTVMRNMCGVGLYFVMLSNMTAILRSKDGTLTSAATLIAGASARSLSAMVLCPLSVVKTRFETKELATKYTGVWNAVLLIWRKERLAGLFAGLWPTIIRDAPYSALYLMVYIRSKEWLERALKARDQQRQGLPTRGLWAMSVNFSCGIVGGGLATLLTQPQDVVKTRMQLSRHVRGRSDKYATVLTTIRRMFNEEGLYGFFRGSSPRFAKRCLGSAITWTIYEETVRFYDRIVVRSQQFITADR